MSTRGKFTSFKNHREHASVSDVMLSGRTLVYIPHYQDQLIVCRLAANMRELLIAIVT